MSPQPGSLSTTPSRSETLPLTQTLFYSLEHIYIPPLSFKGLPPIAAESSSLCGVATWWIKYRTSSWQDPRTSEDIDLPQKHSCCSAFAVDANRTQLASA